MIGPLGHAAQTARIAGALGAKDLRIAWSYRLSFLLGHLGIFGSMVIFYFVSRVIGENELFGSPQEYFQFIVIGMALSGLVDTALSAAIAQARSDQVQGTLEALASLPVSPASLGLGWLSFPLVDGLIGAIITVLLAIPLGFTGADPNWLSLFVVAVLSVAVFGAFGLIGAGLVLAFQQGAGAVTFVTSGLALVSGALFPISVLPGWLQVFSDISPLRYSLDAMRGAALENASLGDLSHELTILGLMVVFLIPVSVAALNAGFAHARKTGGLGVF